MNSRTKRLCGAVAIAFLTTTALAQEANSDDWSSRPPTDNELIAGLREYPLEIVRALMTVSNQSDLIARVAGNEQYLQNPESISPRPDDATLTALKTLVRVPDVLSVAAAHKEPLQRMGSLYKNSPQQWEKRLSDFRLAYRAQQLEAIRAWETALRNDPVALGQYRDVLTAYSKKQQQEFPGFPVATVSQREYYYACPPSEILFEYLDENRPPEALDNVLINWFTNYAAPVIDTKALVETGTTTLPPVPRDVLALQAPDQRKNMWKIDANNTNEGVGLVPVILQPEGDQPIDARLAKGVIEHDRLWSPTWIPNESQNGQNAPQTANLAPVNQDEIFDNAFDNEPTYTDDGQVVYDMQPIGRSSSSRSSGWDDADWNFTPTYESDVDRVAAARADYQDDVTVRLGEYGDPGYYDNTTYVDTGYAAQPTTIVYNTVDYVYDYPSFGSYPYFSTWGTWGVPYPYFSPYAYYPAYSYYYPGFSFGFSYFNYPRYRYRSYGRLGSFYRGYWDARYGYGYGGYSRAYRVGSRFGRFLSGSGFYGRGGGVNYLGRGYRARSASRFTSRGGLSSVRGRSAATYGYRGSSRDGRRSGATNFLNRSNSSSRFGSGNQPRGVRETNRGSRIGSRDSRTRVGSDNRGRIQQMEPINRGTRGSNSGIRQRSGDSRSGSSGIRQRSDTRGTNSGIRQRSSDPRSGSSGIRQRSSDPRGSNSGIQRRSPNSNSGQMRGIRESNRGTRQRSNVGGNTRRVAPQQGSNSGIRSRQNAPSGRSNIRGTRGSGNEMRATPRSSSAGFRGTTDGFNRSTPTQRTITGARSGSSFNNTRNANRAAPRSSSRSNITGRSAAPSRQSFGRSAAPRSAPRSIQPQSRGSRSGSSFNRGSSRSSPRSMSSGRSSGVRSGGRSMNRGRSSSRGIRSSRGSSRGIRSSGSRGSRGSRRR